MAADTEQKEVVAGRIERCQVIGLKPLSFRGAIAFERVVPPLDTING